MRVYGGMSYEQTMGLPMRVFWHLSGCVVRLLTSEASTFLELSTVAAHNPELAGERLEGMAKVIPEPIVVSARGRIASAKLDREGLDDLRSM